MLIKWTFSERVIPNTVPWDVPTFDIWVVKKSQKDRHFVFYDWCTFHLMQFQNTGHKTFTVRRSILVQDNTSCIQRRFRRFDLATFMVTLFSITHSISINEKNNFLKVCTIATLLGEMNSNRQKNLVVIRNIFQSRNKSFREKPFLQNAIIVV